MYARYVKRVLDFIQSLLALVVLSPLMLVLTVVGVIQMKGNPFFLQKRPGRINPETGKERIFSLIKFRTMTNQTDASGNLLPDELRLTGYGRFLRMTSLDELPELLNILLGQMSFVGPRPLLVKYLSRYSEEQRRRQLVTPGLTGWAQIHGRNSISWEDKFSYDCWYIDHISFRLDAKIILITVMTVLRRKGITSDTSQTMEEFLGSKEELAYHE